MRNIYFIFLMGIVLITASCEKEDEYSSGELIARELQSVIQTNGIERVMNFNLGQSWGNTWVIGDYGKNYKFQGQFIMIEGESYNLNHLIKYQIAEKNGETGSVKFLLLSFY